MHPRSDRTGRRPLHVLCYLHATELGGVERAAVRLCDAWAGSARVTLALGRGDAPHGVDARVAVRHAPASRLRPGSWESLRMILWLPRVIRRERPDALFCAGNTYTVVAVAMRLLLGRRCPPVLAKVSNSLVRPDLPAPARVAHALWCRIQGLAIDGFVGMTPEMTREAQDALGVEASRVDTIPSPLFDEATLSVLSSVPARRTAGGRLIVAIGRLERQKNLPLLLAAFARTGGADHLAIVGEGVERPRIAALIERLGLGRRVTLAGHSRDVTRWLRQADALALPSDYEGVPAVVLEAMAAGLPVIATDCCASMAGLLADGRGVLVPRGDPDALAAALQSLPPPGHDPAAQRAFAKRHGAREAAAAYLPILLSLSTARTAGKTHQEHAFS